MARFLEGVGVRFEREQAVRFCGEGNKKSALVDFILYRQWGMILLEIDDDQHNHYSPLCDFARMLDIIADHVKTGREGKIRIV